jgi:transmembrane sensor
MAPASPIEENARPVVVEGEAGGTIFLASELSEQVLREASEWFARLHGGDAVAQDHLQLAAWLSGGPDRREAYAYVAETCRLAARAHETVKDRPSAIVRLPGVSARWRKLPTPAAAAMAATVIAGVGLSILSQPAPKAYETTIGEIRNITLDDGTALALSGASKIDVAYSDHAREIDLETGEFYVVVGKDPTRPFRVHAGGRIIEDVGTAFDVDAHGQEVRVAVGEGTVLITPAAHDRPFAQSMAGGDSAILSKGQTLTFAADRPLGTPRIVESQQVGTWRVGILTYDHSTLDWLVADLNRRFEGHIAVPDPQLAALPVTLTLKLRDRDGTIGTLEKLLPVHAVNTGPGRIELISPKS